MRGTRQAEALASVLGRACPASTAPSRSTRSCGSRGERVGLTTVYRHLQVLSEDGQLDTIRDASGETLYRRCRSEAHHHHLICRQCGTQRRGGGARGGAVGGGKVAAERRLAPAMDHTVELSGLCPRCGTS